MNPVLDTSALLAYLHQEPGWDVVHEVIGENYIGTVNWCEVAQKTGQKGLEAGRARSLLEEVGITIVPFSQEHAELAAALWKPTKRHGLSLADRACLALAIESEATVLTADKAWGKLDLDIKFQLVR